MDRYIDTDRRMKRYICDEMTQLLDKGKARADWGFDQI